MVTNVQVGPFKGTGNYTEFEVLSPQAVPIEIDGGQLNLQSGNLSSTIGLDAWLYIRQKPTDPSVTGYGDGWIVLEASAIKRVDGKSLRDGEMNNNCQFGVRPPSALGSTAPCYPISWPFSVIVPATWHAVLRFLGDVEDSAVLFLSGP